MMSSLLLSIGLPAGLIVFVLRLVSPYVYKYTLRYNFFATLNFIFGLVGLIHGVATTGGNGGGFMSIAFVLGSIWLFDIYFIKLKRAVPQV